MARADHSINIFVRAIDRSREGLDSANQNISDFFNNYRKRNDEARRERELASKEAAEAAEKLAQAEAEKTKVAKKEAEEREKISKAEHDAKTAEENKETQRLERQARLARKQLDVHIPQLDELESRRHYFDHGPPPAHRSFYDPTDDPHSGHEIRPSDKPRGPVARLSEKTGSESPLHDFVYTPSVHFKYQEELDAARKYAAEQEKIIEECEKKKTAIVKEQSERRKRIIKEESEETKKDYSHLGLPSRQQNAFETGDYKEHQRLLQSVARAPDPDTKLWRSELREKGEDLDRPDSVGMHWTATPDAIVQHSREEPDHDKVIWESRLRSRNQIVPRSDPIWGGKSRSLSWEAEVRTRPQTELDITGRHVWKGEGAPGSFVPTNPDRMDPGWEYTAMQARAKAEPKGHIEYEGLEGRMEKLKEVETQESSITEVVKGSLDDQLHVLEQRETELKRRRELLINEFGDDERQWKRGKTEGGTTYHQYGDEYKVTSPTRTRSMRSGAPEGGVRSGGFRLERLEEHPEGAAQLGPYNTLKEAKETVQRRVESDQEKAYKEENHKIEVELARCEATKLEIVKKGEQERLAAVDEGTRKRLDAVHKETTSQTTELDKQIVKLKEFVDKETKLRQSSSGDITGPPPEEPDRSVGVSDIVRARRELASVEKQKEELQRKSEADRQKIIAEAPKQIERPASEEDELRERLKRIRGEHYVAGEDHEGLVKGALTSLSINQPEFRKHQEAGRRGDPYPELLDDQDHEGRIAQKRREQADALRYELERVSKNKVPLYRGAAPDDSREFPRSFSEDRDTAQRYADHHSSGKGRVEEVGPGQVRSLRLKDRDAQYFDHEAEHLVPDDSYFQKYEEEARKIEVALAKCEERKTEITKKGSEDRKEIVEEEYKTNRKQAESEPGLYQLLSKTESKGRVGEPGITKEKYYEGGDERLPRSDFHSYVHRDESGQPRGALEVYAPHPAMDEQGELVRRPDGSAKWNVHESAVAVDREHRRQGIASSLIKRAEDDGLDVVKGGEGDTYTPSGAALIDSLEAKKTEALKKGAENRKEIRKEETKDLGEQTTAVIKLNDEQQRSIGRAAAGGGGGGRRPPPPPPPTGGGGEDEPPRPPRRSGGDGDKPPIVSFNEEQRRSIGRAAVGGGRERATEETGVPLTGFDRMRDKLNTAGKRVEDLRHTWHRLFDEVGHKIHDLDVALNEENRVLGEMRKQVKGARDNFVEFEQAISKSADSVQRLKDEQEELNKKRGDLVDERTNLTQGVKAAETSRPDAVAERERLTQSQTKLTEQVKAEQISRDKILNDERELQRTHREEAAKLARQASIIDLTGGEGAGQLRKEAAAHRTQVELSKARASKAALGSDVNLDSLKEEQAENTKLLNQSKARVREIDNQVKAAKKNLEVNRQNTQALGAQAQQNRRNLVAAESGLREAERELTTAKNQSALANQRKRDLGDIISLNRQIIQENRNKNRDEIRIAALQGQRDATEKSVLSDRKTFNSSQLVSIRQLVEGHRREESSIRNVRREHDRLRGSFGRLRSDAKGITDVSSAFRFLRNELSGANIRLHQLSGQLRGIVIVAVITFLQDFISALVSVAGSLVSVASSAIEAGTALGGILVSGLAAAVPVAGLLAIAMFRLSKVMEVLKLQQQNQLLSGKRNTDQLNKDRNATEQVTNAKESLAEAEHQVGEAHRNVRAAQKDAQTAQKDLNKAVREGRFDLEDLIAAEKRAELASKGAALSQKEARQAFAAGIQTGDVSGFDRNKLAIQEADLGKDESDAELGRSHIEAAKARKQGVEGLDSVVSAHNQVRDAAERVHDAEKGVADANRGVAKASRALADAQKDAAHTADSQVAAQERLAQSLAQLSPVERKLVRDINSLRDTFKSRFRGISDIIIGAFDRSVNRVNSLLKKVDLGPLRGLSHAIATSIDKITTFNTGARAVQFWNKMIKLATELGSPLTRMFIAIEKILMRIAEAAAPALKIVVNALADWTEKTSQNLDANKGLENFFIRGVRHLRTWAGLFGALIRLFGALFGAGAAKNGREAIESVTRSLDKATKYLRTHHQEIDTFFKRVRVGTGAILHLLGTVAVAMNKAFNPESMTLFTSFIERILIPAIVNAAAWFAVIGRGVTKFIQLPVISYLARMGFSFLLVTKGIKLLMLAFIPLLNILRTIAIVAVRLLLFARLGVVFTTTAEAVRVLVASLGLLRFALITTGIGALIVGLGVLVGAILSVKSKTAQATTQNQKFRDSIRDATNALENQAEAEGQLNDDRLARTSAVIAQKRAEQELKRVRKDPKSTALDIKEAENNVKIARREVSKATYTLRDSEEKAHKARKKTRDETAKAVPGLLKLGSTLQDQVVYYVHHTKNVDKLSRAFRNLQRHGKDASKQIGLLAEAITKLPDGKRIHLILDLLAKGYKFPKLAKTPQEAIKQAQKRGDIPNSTDDIPLVFGSAPRLRRQGGPVADKDGGRIGTGYGGGDRVRVLAEEGEWVIRKEAVSHWGEKTMGHINAAGKGSPQPNTGRNARNRRYAGGGPILRLAGGGGVTSQDTGGTTPDNKKDKDDNKERLAQLGDIIEAFTTLSKKVRETWDGMWDYLVDRARNGNKSIDKISDDMRADFGSNLERMEKSAHTHFNNILTIGKHRFGDLAEAVQSSMQSAAGAVHDGLAYIVDAASDSLDAFGGDRIKLKIKRPSVDKKAGGGMVGEYGEAGQDNQLVMMGRGEAVLNRHQQPYVEQAMSLAHEMGYSPYGGLNELFQGVSTPHYMAGGGRVPSNTQRPWKTYATGGRFTGPGHSGEGFTPVWNMAKSKFGMKHFTGFDGHNRITSSGNVSDHFKHMALDISNGVLTPQEDALNQFIKTRLRPTVKQLIWRNKDQFNGYPIGGHEDHVHFAMQPQYAFNASRMAKIISRALKGLSIEDLLAGGSGGVEVDHVKTPRVEGPKGALQSIAQKSLGKVARQANKFIDKQAAKLAPGGASSIALGPGGAAEKVFDYMVKRKFTPQQAAGFVGVFSKETGGTFSGTIANPTSGATGLAQWLGGRLSALKKKPRWQSLQTQLDYVWEELQGSERGAFRAIKGAKTPGDAARVIDSKYERSDGLLNAVQVAQGAYKRFGGKHAKGGFTGPRAAIRRRGRRVGATTFGGPRDPGTGNIGYRGDNLRGTNSYAELNMGKALGNLPYRTPLRITHGAHSLIARKRDIGRGGGPVKGLARRIDLWWETARKLGLPSSWSGIVEITKAARGKLPGFASGGRSVAEAAMSTSRRRRLLRRKRSIVDALEHKHLSRTHRARLFKEATYINKQLHQNRGSRILIPDSDELRWAAKGGFASSGKKKVLPRKRRKFEEGGMGDDHWDSDMSSYAVGGFVGKAVSKLRKTTKAAGGLIGVLPKFAPGGFHDPDDDDDDDEPTATISKSKSKSKKKSKKKKKKEDPIDPAPDHLPKFVLPKRGQKLKKFLDRASHLTDVIDALLTETTGYFDLAAAALEKFRNKLAIKKVGKQLERHHGKKLETGGFVEKRERPGFTSQEAAAADDDLLEARKTLIEQVKEERDITKTLDAIKKSEKRLRAARKHTKSKKKRGKINDALDKLKTSQNNLQLKLDDVAKNRADQLQAVFDAETAQIEQSVSDVQEAATSVSSNIDRKRRSLTARGFDTQAAGSFFDEQKSALQAEKQALQQAKAKAHKIGNHKLEKDIGDQIAEIDTQVDEIFAQQFQAGIDAINKESERQTNAVERQRRILTAIGQSSLANSSAMFDRLEQIDRQKQGQLQSSLAILNSRGEGNSDRAHEIQDMISELDAAIADLAQQRFQAAIDEVNKAADLQKAILDAKGRIAELAAQIAHGDATKDLIEIAKQRDVLLKEQNQKLTALLEQAKANNNKDQIDSLTQQLLDNQVATLENTLALQELVNKTNAPQTFSTTAWQLFRTAIFNGSGGLLPQFASAVPAMDTGGMVTKDGLFKLHAGEFVEKADKSNVSTGDHIEVNVTSPTEVLDPQHVADVISFRQSIARATGK